MKIIVKHYTGEEIPVEVEITTTIKQLRESLSQSNGEEMMYTRLVFEGKRLDNDKTIAEYEIKENDTVRSVGLLVN